MTEIEISIYFTYGKQISLSLILHTHRSAVTNINVADGAVRALAEDTHTHTHKTNKRYSRFHIIISLQSNPLLLSEERIIICLILYSHFRPCPNMPSTKEPGSSLLFLYISRSFLSSKVFPWVLHFPPCRGPGGSIPIGNVASLVSSNCPLWEERRGNTTRLPWVATRKPEEGISEVENYREFVLS